MIIAYPNVHMECLLLVSSNDKVLHAENMSLTFGFVRLMKLVLLDATLWTIGKIKWSHYNYEEEQYENYKLITMKIQDNKLYEMTKKKNSLMYMWNLKVYAFETYW